jgi:hypothetical protein
MAASYRKKIAFMQGKSSYVKQLEAIEYFEGRMEFGCDVEGNPGSDRESFSNSFSCKRQETPCQPLRFNVAQPLFPMNEFSHTNIRKLQYLVKCSQVDSI